MVWKKLVPLMKLECPEQGQIFKVHVQTRAFPILTVITTSCGFFAGYILAAYSGKTPWILPYISDGGTFPPESCIFGFLLGLAGMFWMCTVAAVHIRLNTHIRTAHQNRLPLGYRFVLWAMVVMGVVSGGCVVVVGSFQETNDRWLHCISALFAFSGGILYLWVFILVTAVIRPCPTPVHMMVVRCGVIVCSSIAYMVGIANNLPSVDANGTAIMRPIVPEGRILRVPWGSQQHGWYLINTYTEWFLALSFVFMILTLSLELGPFELHSHRMMSLKEREKGGHRRECELFRWLGSIWMDKTAAQSERQTIGSMSTSEDEEVRTTDGQIKMSSSG